MQGIWLSLTYSLLHFHSENGTPKQPNIQKYKRHINIRFLHCIPLTSYMYIIYNRNGPKWKHSDLLHCILMRWTYTLVKRSDTFSMINYEKINIWWHCSNWINHSHSTLTGYATNDPCWKGIIKNRRHYTCRQLLGVNHMYHVIHMHYAWANRCMWYKIWSMWYKFWSESINDQFFTLPRHTKTIFITYRVLFQYWWCRKPLMFYETSNQ